jgi:hypothetical protein
MRNHPIVGSPFGTPAPLSTADDVVIDVAAEVVAVGAAAYACKETLDTATNTRARETDIDIVIASGKRFDPALRPMRRVELRG